MEKLFRKKSLLEPELELERLFLVSKNNAEKVLKLLDEQALDINKNISAEKITQTYLLDGSRIRKYEEIQRVRDLHTNEIKETPTGKVHYDWNKKTECKDIPGSKNEAEKKITELEYLELKKLKTGSLVKTRFTIFGGSNMRQRARKIDLDRIELEEDEVLYLAEVEFNSAQGKNQKMNNSINVMHMNHYVAEDWFGEELTGKLNNWQLALGKVKEKVKNILSS